MPVTAECPVCGHKGSVPDQFKGKKVKCRECANLFTVGGEAATAGARPAAKQKSNPDMNGSGSGMDLTGAEANGVAGGESSANPFDFESPDPQPAPKPTRKSEQGIQKTGKSAQGTQKVATGKSAQGNQKSPAAKPRPKKKRAEPLPIAAMVLGAIALLMGMAAIAIASKGLIGLASVPVGGFGLLLAIAGIVMALGRPPLGLIAPALGLLVCLASVGVGGYHTYELIAGGALSSPEDAARKAGSTQPQTGGTNPEVRIPTPQPHTEPPPPPPPPDQWVDARQGYRMGKAVVKVTGVEADMLRSKDGKELSKDRNLLIRLEIKNIGSSDLDYFSWATSQPQGDDPWPQLTDSAGTAIKRTQPDGVILVNQVAKAASVPAGQSIYDVLAFELPADSISFLKLELTGSNIGETGRLKLQLPKVMLDAFVKGIRPNPGGDPVPKQGDPRMARFVQEQVAMLGKAKTEAEKATAIGFIAGCGKDAAAAAPELARFLKANQPAQVRAAAADAIGKIGPAAKAQIPDLRAALKDEFWKVKANAARALGNMGPDAKVAIPDLLPLVNSKDDEVPQSAKEAIRKLDPTKLPK